MTKPSSQSYVSAINFASSSLDEQQRGDAAKRVEEAVAAASSVAQQEARGAAVAIIDAPSAVATKAGRLLAALQSR